MASENEQNPPTGKAEVLERLLPGWETKLIACGKLVWVDDTADGKHSAKRGASTNAGYFQHSGIHAAEAVGS